MPVYLEVGPRRIFAGAIDWPGWCRSGRDEETALEALVATRGLGDRVRVREACAGGWRASLPHCRVNCPLLCVRPQDLDSIPFLRNLASKKICLAKDEVIGLSY